MIKTWSPLDLSINLVAKFNAWIDFLEPSLHTATLTLPCGVLDLNEDSPFTIRTGQGECNPMCWTALPRIVWSLFIHNFYNNVLLTLWGLFCREDRSLIHQLCILQLFQPSVLLLFYLMLFYSMKDLPVTPKAMSAAHTSNLVLKVSCHRTRNLSSHQKYARQ